jgi:hypothetical protein
MLTYAAYAYRYLTFAAHCHLSDSCGLRVRTQGVELRQVPQILIEDTYIAVLILNATSLIRAACACVCRASSSGRCHTYTYTDTEDTYRVVLILIEDTYIVVLMLIEDTYIAVLMLTSGAGREDKLVVQRVHTHIVGLMLIEDTYIAVLILIEETYIVALMLIEDIYSGTNTKRRGWGRSSSTTPRVHTHVVVLMLIGDTYRGTNTKRRGSWTRLYMTCIVRHDCLHRA